MFARLSIILTFCTLTFKALETKIAKCANNVNPDEVAHHEPPHLELHWLHSSL